MDWYTSCSYAPGQKRRFHAATRARLRRLAAELGFPPASFDLRSNQGGIAVSGEITLHHARVYVQVCQPATRADSGILIRTCEGRRDYTGGRNHFAPLSTRCASASAASARRHSGISRQGTDDHGGERWRGLRRLRGRGGPGQGEPDGVKRERPGGSPHSRSFEVSAMNFITSPAAIAPIIPRPGTGPALIAAASLILAELECGRRIDAQALRAAMTTAFNGADAEGAWDWKTAYDACEAAQVLFLRKFGPAMRARAASPIAILAMLEKLAALLPSQTRRSQESQALQQFSTPIAPPTTTGSG